MKKQPGWPPPVAITLASIFGCDALANGFGFVLKRPDAVSAFAAMLYCGRVRTFGAHRTPRTRIFPIFAASAIATTVRGTLAHRRHALDWI